MAEFYLDHDVSHMVGRLLRGHGHTVTTARALGLEAVDDAFQLLTATQRHATILTHNAKDFRLLHRAWQWWSGAWGVQQAHGGALVLPHAPEADTVQPVLAFLQLGLPITNTVYRYYPARGWESFT